MASITLKTLPSRLHRALKARAARHQRSLNQEVLALLEESVGTSRRIDVEALVNEARRFRASLRLKTSAKQLDEFKRRGRA